VVDTKREIAECAGGVIKENAVAIQDAMRGAFILARASL
jgi:hypothetical protein